MGTTTKGLPIRLAVLILILIAATAFATDPEWPMFQNDAAHTGYVPVTLDPTNFSLRWQTNVYGWPLNPVTAAAGKVFVSDSGYYFDGGLSALDATTGNVQWSNSYDHVAYVNPPCYADGKVFIQVGQDYVLVGEGYNGGQFLRAYQPETGAVVFTNPFASRMSACPPTIYGGSIYMDGGNDVGMYSIDALSGSSNWFCNFNRWNQWTPAVDSKYAYSYVSVYCDDCFYDHYNFYPHLTVVDRLSGAIEFTIPDTNSQYGEYSMNLAPVLGAGNDALVIHDGRLISFDLVNRTIRWQLSPHFRGQPSLAKGVIYAINGGVLNAIDEFTGQLLWTWESPTPALNDTMIVTDSHIFVRNDPEDYVGTQSTVFAVNLQTHQCDWSYPVSGHLALSEGVLYIAGKDGVLTAINAPSIPSHQPIAVAGGPYNAECTNGSAVFSLDGSRSSDPDGHPLILSWNTDCDGATFDDSTSPTPKLTMNCAAGESCTITLTVTDGLYTNSSRALVSLPVSLEPLLSDAGGPCYVDCEGSYTPWFQLDGSRSSGPRGAPLTDHWSSDCPNVFFSGLSSSSQIAAMSSDCFPGLSCTVTLTVSDPHHTNASSAKIFGPPFSSAGGPYSAECRGKSQTVQLDGHLSFDPAGQPLTYSWSTDCSGATFDDPSSPTPILHLNSSSNMDCNVTLTVSDGHTTTSSQAQVNVSDNEPPHFVCAAATPATLWPPTGRLVPVTIQGIVMDACDSAPNYRIISVTSNDPIKPGDYKIIGQHTVALRAERSSSLRKRVYYVTVKAWDASGNTTRQTLSVTVPLWGK